MPSDVQVTAKWSSRYETRSGTTHAVRVPGRVPVRIPPLCVALAFHCDDWGRPPAQRA